MVMKLLWHDIFVGCGRLQTVGCTMNSRQNSLSPPGARWGSKKVCPRAALCHDHHPLVLPQVSHTKTSIFHSKTQPGVPCKRKRLRKDAILHFEGLSTLFSSRIPNSVKILSNTNGIARSGKVSVNIGKGIITNERGRDIRQDHHRLQ